jgi:hypothetical protein
MTSVSFGLLLLFYPLIVLIIAAVTGIIFTYIEDACLYPTSAGLILHTKLSKLFYFTLKPTFLSSN